MVSGNARVRPFLEYWSKGDEEGGKHAATPLSITPKNVNGSYFPFSQGKAVAFFRAVKTPETPSRTYLPKLADPQHPAPAEEREVRMVPRYVEIPALRERGFGPRNLFWGLATLFLAVVTLIVALFFAGPGATLSLATSLLTFTALFVLARLHVFRQRNGGFLALAIVCLLGAAVPLIESGFSALKSGAGSWSKSTTGGSSAGGESQPPLLIESFALTPPEGPGKRVKVLKDSRVIIDQRPFLIKAGDVFSFVDVKGGEATFAVRDLQVSLPANVVDIIDPTAVAQGVTGRRSAPAAASSGALPSESANPPAVGAGSAPVSSSPTPEELKAITLSAQREAIRRFPALGIRDSLENAVFVETFQRLRESGNTEFFANPEWPIALADQLAKRDGWVPGGAPMTTSPAPVLDAPADAPVAPAPTGNGPAARGGTLPPVDQLDAGAGLPSNRGSR